MATRRSDITNVGGSREAFLTTEWSLIEGIKRGEDRGDSLLGQLLERYWKPVYCFLRRKGLDNETAKDLTQGFFHEVVLRRDLVRRADHARGSFRRLLLTALEHYVRSVHRKEVAQKRLPKGKRLPFDQIDLGECQDLTADLTPEESFNYVWLASLLDEVLGEVEAACQAHGLQVHWQIFHGRVLEPIMNDTEPPLLMEIGLRYGVPDPVKAFNMIITVNRRLQTALRRRLRQYVLTDALAEEELTELLEVFRPNGAE